MSSNRLPLCTMCGQYPISKTGSAACKSPKCKRQLAEERRRMETANRTRKMDAKREKARMDLIHPGKLKRETAADVRRFMQYGFTEVEAVWRVARETGLTPAEVLLAHQERGEPAG